jgi:dinuclear metal center YbgI/SA1388 family protein
VASRDDIVAFADELLDIGGFRDALPLGLQVPGAADVRLVVSGVSASLELFTAAAAAGAQMVLVHHGLFWDGEPRRIGPRERARLECLFRADLSLVAYHLPLDAHPELGNNAILCRELGAGDVRPAFPHGGRDIGMLASFTPPLRIDDVVARVRERVNPAPLVLAEGPDLIATIGVVSGAAANDLAAAADAGADLFLTGEPKEPAFATAREAGVHFIAAGHHATEVFGVRALGDLIATRFGVEHRFVDVPNPI